jgi:tRNA (cytidine/uridine-2'-O-)-methyltransferase
MTRTVTSVNHVVFRDPYLHVVLFQPEIPANTGNIARLCGATELPLHLIHPIGFRLDDKHLKRAGLDYWPQVDVREHPDFDHFLKRKNEQSRILAFSRHASEPYTNAEISRGDCLLFGAETQGLPLPIRRLYPCYAIPIWGNIRSLNLSTAVGIVTYHYLQRLRRF